MDIQQLAQQIRSQYPEQTICVQGDMVLRYSSQQTPNGWAYHFEQKYDPADSGKTLAEIFLAEKKA
jgi:hypothetical protein